MSEPITRSEMYLAALGGEAVTPPEPITRLDMYLAYLNGMTDTYPEPITRTEQYLYKLCQNGMGGGGGVTIRNQDKTITANGQYGADSGYTGLGTVTVAVPQEEPVVEPLEVTENGTYNPPEGVDGYGPVTVNVEASGGGDDLARAIVERTITEYSNSEITTIGKGAFFGCAELSVINIPKATVFGDNAFDGCTKITNIDFPEVITIGSYCFANNANITSVRLSKLKTMGKNCFKTYAKITELYLPVAENIGYACIQGSPITKENIYTPMAKVVENAAFYQCGNIDEVNFLPNAETLGAQCLSGIGSLTKVDLPKVTTINQSTFSSDSKLKTVILRTAEKCCALNNVSAFDGTPFASGGTGGTVYVPSALISTYQTATNWSTLYAAGTCNFVAIEGSEYE